MHFRKLLWLNSLAFKILLSYVAGAILSVGLLVLLGSIVKDRLPGMQLADRTLSLAQELKFDEQGRPTGFSTGQEHPLWIYDSLSQETAYRILDDKGNVVLISPGARLWPDRPDLSALKRGRFEFARDGALHDGATEPIESGGRTWFIQLSVSSRIIEFLHQEFALPFIRFGVLVFSLVLFFIFGICAFISLRYSLRPLRKAAVAATAISPRSLGERLAMDGVPSEVTPLINSFNQALDRLEKGYRIQQDFLAKAAHELKTPLTLIRAEVELMEDELGVRGSLLAHVEHLARHVQQLLLLAEASEPLSYQFNDVDAYEVAHDSVFFLQKIADEADVTLSVSAAFCPHFWRADRGAFFTLMKNLIENALQHAPAGTEVLVVIDADTITVRDQGPGVEPEQLKLLFARFWRGAHRRDCGAGLGLAICQEICSAHGWTILARNAAPGFEMKVLRSNASKQ